VAYLLHSDEFFRRNDDDDEPKSTIVERHTIFGQSGQSRVDRMCSFSVLSTGWTGPGRTHCVDCPPGLAATGHVSEWGGMEVGNGMLYPVSVVDGLVHQLGGWQLQAEIKYLQLSASFFSISSSSPLPTPCPIGKAVATTAGAATSPLRQHYDAIIHTAPPFYQHHSSSVDDGAAALNPEWHQLRSCYESTLALLRDECRSQPVVAAVPLLGAGARGFPAAMATQVAASAMAAWLRQEDQEHGFERDDRPNRTASDDDTTHHHHPIVIAFGLLEAELADELCNALEENGVV
jgi:O-acetyl-ADP-ribose deacetylase (regulator of RNase III)